MANNSAPNFTTVDGHIQAPGAIVTPTPTQTSTVTPPTSDLNVSMVNGHIQAPGAKVAQTPTPATPPVTSVAPGSANPDQSFFDSMGILDPNNTDSYKDKIFSYYAGKSAADVQAIKDTAAAAEMKANNAIGRDTSAANLDASRRGMTSTDNSVLSSKAVTDQQEAIASAEAAKSSSLATVADNINKSVDTAFTAEQGTAKDYIATKQATMTGVMKDLVAKGLTLDDLKTSNPNEYQKILQYSGGDDNALSAAFAMQQSPTNVLQSWFTGSSYNQLVTNPVTGKPQVQSFDMKATIPTSWVAQKIGTTSIVMQDPSNPSNTVIYSTNPFTGGTTINGTGTGLDLLKAQGINPGSSSDTGTGTGTGAGSGNATTTVATALGVDPATPLADVVSTSGIGAVVAAIMKNEGGSPAGVQNNPGNVKFTGAPGQTDSGVKATDGGTFASYATPQDGQQAIASLVTGAASGTNQNYGSNPTLQSFVEKYTNTGSANTTVNQTTGLDTKQYGLLANVSGFTPNKDGEDKAVWNYINEYLTQGKIPTSASVGVSTKGGLGYAFNNVADRAADVYFKATGQHLPNADILSSNLKLVSGNNQLLNNLKVQEGTIAKNFGLNLENLNANNVNQSAPVINKIVDSLAKASGSTSVAQYLTQNSTIQQELGSLLAVKNASGTTVADKLAAGDLLPSDLSADQQKVILSTLMKEANNAQRTVGETNAGLYEQTDPLGIDPNNPVNAPGYKEATAAGMTPNYDGTYTAPNGTVWDAEGNQIQ